MDTDEEALDAIKTFLSYLPENQKQLPPEKPVSAGSDEAARSVLDVLPEKRTQVYDVRKIIEHLADKGSVFELKSRFGKTATTALARLAYGRPRCTAHAHAQCTCTCTATPQM